MTSKTVHLATRSVRYLEAGVGRPLVLIHAFPLHADQWLPQLVRPARGWRVVAPDLRGLGPMSVLLQAEPLTIDSHAADILELMTHLEIDRAVVGGLSMGGYVALAMAARAPARVQGLVLADTRATADTPEAKAGRDRMLAIIAREGSRGVANEMLPNLLGDTTRREQPDLADALRRIIESNAVEGLSAAVRALKDRADRTALLPAITCPTLVVCGAEDVLTPTADAELMYDAIPASSLIIVPHAGHLSNVENPSAFNAALWEFDGFSALR